MELIGLADTRQVTVTGLEMFQKTLDESMAGDNCGMLLRGVLKETIQVRAEADTFPTSTCRCRSVWVHEERNALCCARPGSLPPAASSFLWAQRGMVLAKPGSIKPHSKFEASVYVLKKEEGAATRRSSRGTDRSSSCGPRPSPGPWRR